MEAGRRVGSRWSVGGHDGQTKYEDLGGRTATIQWREGGPGPDRTQLDRESHFRLPFIGQPHATTRLGRRPPPHVRPFLPRQSRPEATIGPIRGRDDGDPMYKLTAIAVWRQTASRTFGPTTSIGNCRDRFDGHRNLPTVLERGTVPAAGRPSTLAAERRLQHEWRLASQMGYRRGFNALLTRGTPQPQPRADRRLCARARPATATRAPATARSTGDGATRASAGVSGMWRQHTHSPPPAPSPSRVSNAPA